jgi:hypothetical protein
MFNFSFFLKVLFFGVLFLPGVSFGETIFEQYASGEKIRVLLVPGHDEDSVGTAFLKLREVDLNRELVSLLVEEFALDDRFEILQAHEGKEYSSFLQEYFDTYDSEISVWRRSHISNFRKKLESGVAEKIKNPSHGGAKPFVAQRLYGINKWVEENNIDLVIHVHFNDYGSRKKGKSGEFTGFAVYVPDLQFRNGRDTFVIGEGVYKALSQVQVNSNQSQEGKYDGPIPDQDLIALGAFDTLSTPSFLIEYGYIYEPLLHTGARGELLRGFASATYRGVRHALDNRLPFFVKRLTDDVRVDYTWHRNLVRGNEGEDVFALQRFLRGEGYFPPKGKNQKECGFSLYFGDCTEKALQLFQSSQGLATSGVFGNETRNFVDKLFKKEE